MMTLDTIVPVYGVLDSRFFDIELVYANQTHPLNQFGQIYRSSAMMLGELTFLPAINSAGMFCHRQHGWRLRIYVRARSRTSIAYIG